MQTIPPKILFVINPGSGNKNTDWKKEIQDFFRDKPNELCFYELHKGCLPKEITAVIEKEKPQLIAAAGGDGTVKLVAECVIGKEIPVAILPAGSANGMAKELSIPEIPAEALEILITGVPRKIHLLEVNNELCIHLSDAGFNAYVVKEFQQENKRGKWGYVKAAWKALWKHNKIEVSIKVDDEYKKCEAAMVVLANATMYGNGVVINPEGTLSDDLFEIVIIKKISFIEIFKMRFTQKEFNENKTELLQTSSVKLNSKHRFHFQVDGEYRGKMNTVEATIKPAALSILVGKEAELSK